MKVTVCTPASSNSVPMHKLTEFSAELTPMSPFDASNGKGLNDDTSQ